MYKQYTPDELARWIPQLIRDNNIHAFYICKAWQHLRIEVLTEQKNECQLCKVKGRYSEATTVHHIKHLRQYPRFGLDKKNLMALCDECHYKIHHTKEIKWNDERW